MKVQMIRALSMAGLGAALLEYGGTWGSFQLAEARTMNCSEAGSNWSCMASARPCKRDVRPGKAVPQTARN
jgi:hypothetical protein